MAKKNAKNNAEVAVVEETKKKVAKKTAEKKPVEKSVKKTSAKTAEKKTSEKKPVEKAVKIAKKIKTTEKVEKPVEKVSKLDKIFPTEINIEGEILTRRNDIDSWEAFQKLFEEESEAGNSVFLVDQWLKKSAKDYEANYYVKMPKSGFDNNLDVNEVQFFQQTVKRCLTVSLYTEAISTMHAEDFVRDEEGMIVVFGIPCEVYVTTEK